MKPTNDNFVSESDYLMKKAAELFAAGRPAQDQSCNLVRGGFCPLIRSFLETYGARPNSADGNEEMNTHSGCQ